MTGSRKHDLRTAATLTEGDVKRRAEVTIGRVTGRLVGVYPVGDKVNLCVSLGGPLVTWFGLEPDTEVMISGGGAK